MTTAIDPQILAFAAFAALLTIIPGADTMLVIRNVMARGQRAGLFTTLGACSGLFIHATLSALGLSLILVRSATAFDVVKTIGAGYLVWLGIQSLRQAFRRQPREIVDIEDAALRARPGRSRRSFAEGLLSNVLNPKVAVFYLALLPQLMSPSDWVFGKSILLAGIHWVEGVLWLSTLTLFLGRLRWWISQARVKRAIEATAGVVLIAFGLRLAMERAR
ncbi:MAG: threonine transporter RhtB [Candidatus Rokuibacteriota bacterium]|nr:MAG: threonine transporter RhtB [Candidatus Rokubacteria bacterium]